MRTVAKICVITAIVLWVVAAFALLMTCFGICVVAALSR